MSAFDGLPQALRTLCVRDGRALQDIAHASRISPAMLSSYMTGRETPTLKTLEKLLDGLKLRLEDLAGALEEVQGHGRRRPARSADEDLVLGFPRQEVEKIFMEQLVRLGLEPKRKAEEKANPPAKPRKAGKA
ncbi:MAG TPA: helix-turn-helix transcriptional regulator [Thermoanaerobaculia bacterium]|nr:helix-turn-helix transcriptional regulator [Thermoanaerobaculia bacterium]